MDEKILIPSFFWDQMPGRMLSISEELYIVVLKNGLLFFGGAVDSTSQELTSHSYVSNHSFGESAPNAVLEREKLIAMVKSLLFHMF